MTPRSEVLVQDLCEEIDSLEAQVKYWRGQAEHWQMEHGKLISETIKNSHDTAAGLLVLALRAGNKKDA